ncbi:AAA family ATPase [Hymenobacter properus]|uniref:ATP/GTP-binding protein n=1 Tax=Hymenobacter properus TaxID=2791026 RepID=A0A931FLC4_9BACT|nr:ATP/GTP-binding protein [Hymenobacter properus]MBF9142695.1 ATP/GTP-binding protein [Hymenobacter properus]
MENFLSFKERAELSMVPGKTQRQESHVYKFKGKSAVNLLKGAVIYGANASGKSNLVKAVQFAKKLVTGGTRSNSPIPTAPFKLNSNTPKQATRIEFEVNHKGMHLAYGFEVTASRVLEEWLYKVSSKSERKIFTRKWNSATQKFDTEFKNIKFKNNDEAQFLNFIAKATRENQLFLAEVLDRKVEGNVDGIDTILAMLNWFDKVLVIITPTSIFHGLEGRIQDNARTSDIYAKYLSYFDTGISGLSLVSTDIDQIPDMPADIKDDLLEATKTEKKARAFIGGPDNQRYMFCKNGPGEDEWEMMRLVTQHKHSDSDAVSYFEINEESDGTRRLMDLIPAVLDFGVEEKVFFVDELDRSLHPIITRTIVDNFFNRSPNAKSQLIVTTHESGILDQDILRKDEVWFVKKAKDKSSMLYSLEEFKPRFDTDIRKGYLNGRFGAIPFIHSQEGLQGLIES